MRNTVRDLNLAFRNRGIQAQIVKQGGSYALLAQIGGRSAIYLTAHRLNIRDSQEWIEQARAAEKWLQQRIDGEARRTQVRWRQQRNAARRRADAVPPPLPAAEPEKQPHISHADAVALAHMIASDLAEDNLQGSIRTVQELVGGPVRQANGAYKRVLIVGNWVIKADKRRKPGNGAYVGAAAEAEMISQIQRQHTDLAKHFPITTIVNYYTTVQERADPNAGRYFVQHETIRKIAETADIGDVHPENVGWREGDETPVFIDVSRGLSLDAPDYVRLNRRYELEHNLYLTKRAYESTVHAHLERIALLEQELSTLNAGA